MSETMVIPMPRKAREDGEDSRTVKLAESVLRDVKALAGFAGQDTSLWLTNFLRLRLPDELEKMCEEIRSRSNVERQKRNRP